MSRAALVLFASITFLACKDGGSDRCITSADCADGQGCYLLPTGAQRCLAACDASERVLCDTGELCVSVTGEDAADDVCLPGGNVPLGASCATSSECTKGAMCFTRDGTSACRRACELGGTAACLSNETCTSVDPDAGVTRGACL